MTEKKIIYLVTEGEYSDYHIEGVFSSRELAEEYISGDCKDGSIEEYYLDDKAIPLVEYEISVNDTFYDVVYTRNVHSWYRHGYYWRGGHVYYFSVVLPISKANAEVALKIVQDWFTQIKAMNLDFRSWRIVTRKRDSQ